MALPPEFRSAQIPSVAHPLGHDALKASSLWIFPPSYASSFYAWISVSPHRPKVSFLVPQLPLGSPVKAVYLGQVMYLPESAAKTHANQPSSLPKILLIKDSSEIIADSNHSENIPRYRLPLSATGQEASITRQYTEKRNTLTFPSSSS